MKGALLAELDLPPRERRWVREFEIEALSPLAEAIIGSEVLRLELEIENALATPS